MRMMFPRHAGFKARPASIAPQNSLNRRCLFSAQYADEIEVSAHVSGQISFSKLLGFP
jgi:hypothetical protein